MCPTAAAAAAGAASDAAAARFGAGGSGRLRPLPQHAPGGQPVGLRPTPPAQGGLWGPGTQCEVLPGQQAIGTRPGTAFCMQGCFALSALRGWDCYKWSFVWFRCVRNLVVLNPPS
jgi:hypothetical protein